MCGALQPLTPIRLLWRGSHIQELLALQNAYFQQTKQSSETRNSIRNSRSAELKAEAARRIYRVTQKKGTFKKTQQKLKKSKKKNYWQKLNH